MRSWLPTGDPIPAKRTTVTNFRAPCDFTTRGDMTLYSPHHRVWTPGPRTNAIAPLLHDVQMYLHGVRRYDPVLTPPSGYEAKITHHRHPSIKKTQTATDMCELVS